jgi:hypothetical protein
LNLVAMFFFSYNKVLFTVGTLDPMRNFAARQSEHRGLAGGHGPSNNATDQLCREAPAMVANGQLVIRFTTLKRLLPPKEDLKFCVIEPLKGCKKD